VGCMMIPSIFNVEREVRPLLGSNISQHVTVGGYMQLHANILYISNMMQQLLIHQKR